MNQDQVIAMWVGNILQDYAASKGLAPQLLPAVAETSRLTHFLVDNYELFHLYPDDAVFDEINAEIAGHENG
jgi:hypothetical protein